MSEPKKRAPWIHPDTPEPFCEWCGGTIPPGRERYCSATCLSECIDEPNWDTSEPEEDEE